MKFQSYYENNPKLAGQLADKKKLFGKQNRYSVAPVHSRFDKVGWFVWDAETYNLKNYDKVMGYEPALIRIADSYNEAILGLV